MSSRIHSYATRLDWSGSTGLGYDNYQRRHRVSATPADQSLTLTADTAFLGEASLLNPEQLLVAAASSCQLLSFLAVAARSRIDVVDYSDDATAEMDENDPPVRITTIRLNPVITVAGAPERRPSEQRLRRLVELAHRECFIANSLKSEVEISATFRYVLIAA